MITAVFVIGVALLGQTTFEIDTVQMNGQLIFLNPLTLNVGSS